MRVYHVVRPFFATEISLQLTLIYRVYELENQPRVVVVDVSSTELTYFDNIDITDWLPNLKYLWSLIEVDYISEIEADLSRIPTPEDVSIVAMGLTGDIGPTGPIGNTGPTGPPNVEYLVGPAGEASYQTIQSAVDQAVADGHDKDDPAIVFILEDTYIEDVTLYPGISLEAHDIKYHSGFPPICTVFIQGALTFAAGTSNGSVFVRGIKIEPTTGVTVTISGSAVSKTVVFSDCHLESSDNLVFQHTGTNWGIVSCRKSYIKTGHATLPLMVIGDSEQLAFYDSYALAGDFDSDLVQLEGGRFIAHGQSGQDHGTLGGVVNVASGSDNFLQLIGCRFLSTASSDVVVTGSLDVSRSLFLDVWRASYSGEDREPITISGPNASQLNEAPRSAVEGDVWRYDGSKFQLSNEIETGILAQAEPMGFPNITDTDIAWDDGSKTFTLSKTGSSFDVWVKSIRYNFTSNQTLVGDGTDFTIAEGIWYFYFDATGTLVASQTYWDYSQIALVALIYWDATNSTAIIFADERHTSTMDWATHEYLHETRGTAYDEGLDLTATLDGDASVDIHAQVAVSNGIIHDEDMKIVIVDGSGSGRFEQELTPTAEIPIYYRDGAAGNWRKKPTDTFPVYQGSLFAATRCGWNDPDAGGPGIWGITEIGNNRYTDIIICATDNYDEPTIAILGQMDYNTLNSARDADPLSTMNLVGLPVQEVRYLYRLILQTGTAYTNTIKARWRSPFTDYRTADLGAPASETLPADHQALSNRPATGAHPASAVETDTTNFDGLLSAADDTVQKALDTLDDGAPPASDIVTDTSNFDSILSPTDDTVQKALDTIDDGVLPLAGGTMTGNITMSEDTWIGRGGAAERIVFNGSAGTIEFQDAVAEFYDAIDLMGNPIINVSILETAAIGPYVGSVVDIEADFEFQGLYRSYYRDATTSIYSANVGYMDYVAPTAHRLISSLTHVIAGSSGASPHSFARFVVEDDSDAMVLILTQNDDQAWYGFGDPQDSYVAGIHYDHSLDILDIQSADTVVVKASATAFQFQGTVKAEFNSTTEYINSGAAGYLDAHWADDDKGMRFYSGANLMMTIQRNASGAGAVKARLALPASFFMYADSTNVAQVTTTQWYCGVDFRQPDNERHYFGTGTNCSIYYNATNMILDPDLVGTGKVYIGATADDDIVANAFITTIVGTEYVTSNDAGYMDYSAATQHRFNNNLRLYQASTATIMLVETGDTSNASLEVKNSANDWRFSVGASGNFSYRDISGGDVSVMTILKGANRGSIYIETAKVNINVNEDDVDCQIRGASNSNLIRTDAGNDRVGFGINDPAVFFEISGTARMRSTSSWQFNTSAFNISSDGSDLNYISSAEHNFTGAVDSDTGFKKSGVQVVGAQVIDARCDDALNSGDATTDGVIDSLRDAMITHGLIAAA